MRRPCPLINALLLTLTVVLGPVRVSAAPRRPPMPVPRPPKPDAELVRAAKPGQAFEFDGVRRLSQLTPAMASFLQQSQGKRIRSLEGGKARIGELTLDKMGRGAGTVYAATLASDKTRGRVRVRVRGGKLEPLSEELLAPGTRNVFRFDYDKSGGVARQVEVRRSGRRYHVIETPFSADGPQLDASRITRAQFKRSARGGQVLRMIDPQGRRLERQIRKRPADPFALAELLADTARNVASFPVLPLKLTIDPAALRRELERLGVKDVPLR